MAKAAYRHTLEIEGERHTRALAELKAWLQRSGNDRPSDDDRQAFDDTLEGASNFYEVMDIIVEQVRDDEYWAKVVIPDKIRQLEDRKARLKRRIEANRSKIANVLINCDIVNDDERSYRRDSYTLTLPRQKLNPVVTDIDALPPSLVIDERPSLNLAAIQMDYEAGMLPERYIMPGPRRADMAAIAAAVDARQEVPGIEITYTQPSLQIR